VIESIASDVVAFVTDQNFFIATCGESLCKDASGETCTHDEVIEHKLTP
jgi:predicted transcriptional regulator